MLFICFHLSEVNKLEAVINSPIDFYAKVAQLVELHVANVVVEGSSPFFRSKPRTEAFFSGVVAKR